MTLAELNEIKKSYKVLELAVDFINPSYNISRAKHLDNARYLVCTLTENGIPRNVKANEVARIRLQKPDKTYVYNDCAVLEDGRVFITLTEQILAVEGNALCDIQLVNERTEVIYSTKNFIINIDKTAVNNSVIASSNEFDALNKLIATNKKINEELKANEKVRQANENERIENENERKDNEADRQNAETERINAENTRKANETVRIGNENTRKANETVRQNQESDRQTNTAAAISNAEKATKKANDAADDLQHKLDTHHFVLTEDKDVAGGVPSLDSNKKVPVVELYEASTSSKGITQLTDSVTSTSTSTAATPNSVKTAYDKAVLAGNDLKAHNTSSTAHEDIRSLITNLTATVGNKVDKVSGKGLSTNDYTTVEKNKLGGISSGAEVNQNAFSNIVVGSVTIAADSKTDTLTIVAGSNITLTADATNDKLTITAKDTTYSAGTASALGLTKLYTGTGTATDGTMTQAAIKTALDGKAASSHGNHVPATQTANNAIFLRNDNTWQTITPANIGAAAVNHSHNYATSSHNHNGIYVYDKANVSGNMNDAAGYRNAMGMINLSNPSSGTASYVNPNGQTGWHHFINMSYSEQSGSNMWQTQIANAAGSTDLWVRSRNGQSVDNTKAWTAPWTRILTGSNWKNVITLSSLGAAAGSHTHNYAGSGSAGGSANSAVKLDSSAGSVTQPVYFKDGKPTACTYTLGKSVPSNAVFTDTTYSSMSGASANADGKAGLVPAPAEGKQASFLRGDGTWQVPTNTTYTTATQLAAGLMSTTDKKKLDGIAEGANKTVVDSTLNSTSTNPVQNKVIKSALDGKAASSHTHSNYFDSNTSRGKNTVLAAPSTGDGAASFRTLTIADLPTASAATNRNRVPVITANGVMEIGEYIDFHTADDANVDFDFRIRGTSTSVYFTQKDKAYGTLYAASYTIASSKRYKNNIVNMPESDAEKLLDIDVKRFDYTIDNRKDVAGCIAEEVEEIFPDVCSYQDEEKTIVEGIDYSKFVPYLIKLVQKQQKEIYRLRKYCNI